MVFGHRIIAGAPLGCDYENPRALQVKVPTAVEELSRADELSQLEQKIITLPSSSIMPLIGTPLS